MWTGIEEVVAVEATGSFAAAAQRLGVSTSHISRAIARLENHLGAQIFSRTTRKVTLTDTGRSLTEYFRRILAEREEAFTQARGDDVPRGQLKLTCSTTLGERFVAPIVRRFVAQHPLMSVTLDLTNRVVDLVTEGYDLAIRTGHLRDSRLVQSRIATRGLILCAAPEYLARSGTPQSIEELAAHECLAGSAHHWFFSRDGKEVRHKPQGRWRCNSGTAVLDAALAGLGLCQLPEFYVRAAMSNGALVPVLASFRPVDEIIWAVSPQRRHMPSKVRDMVQRLRVELGPALAA